MPREETSTPYRAGAARPPPSGLGDVARLLWGQLGFMIVVFVLTFLALAVAAVLLLEKSYTASASLLVRADEAYAYNPVLGDPGAGASLDIDQIIQSEINILRADRVKRRTLERMGLRAVYPDLAADYVEAAPGEARERIFEQAIKRITQNLSVGAAPATANIDISFKHERADTSAAFLNALIESYLDYRPDVLLGDSAEALQDRREEYEARLAGANAALESFLQRNDIGDFENYREELRDRYSEVSASLYAARADREQVRAELGVLRSQLSQLPAEIEQYVENDASGQLGELYLERVDLLSRYTEDAIPVQEINARIAQMEQFLAAGGAEGAGTRRIGPNPVRQELETDELQLTGEAAALERRVAELSRQQEELRAAQQQAQNLAPQYERLARDIASLQDTVGRIADRQQLTRAQRDLASNALDNVSVIEPAVAPIEGSSLKKPAVAGAFIVSGLFALLAGLVRGLLQGAPRPAWLPRPPAFSAPPRARAQAEAAPAAHAHAHAPSRREQPLPVLATIERRPDAAAAYG